MANPRAEDNRLARTTDGILIAALIDDCRVHQVADSTRKKQLICYQLVLFEVLMWETFVEDIVDEGQEFLLAHLTDPTVLGYDVLFPVSDDLSDRKDPRAIWGIAGDSWRLRLREHRRKLLDGFHTPRPANVDKLILVTLGLREVSQYWHWQNATNAQVKRRLSELVTMRGGIAHDLLNVPNVNFQNFVTRVFRTRRACQITANRVRTHIHGLTGHYPWDALQ